MKHFDLIVVGGGPAGVFAAGFAASAGKKVLLLEKNRHCGAKVLITGKGRCNVTNREEDPRRFCENFGRQGKSFLTALYAFGVQETIDFFEHRGLELKTERGGRVFPGQGNATDVQKVLERFMADAGVVVKTRCTVKEMVQLEGRIDRVMTSQGSFSADSFVIATGGCLIRKPAVPVMVTSGPRMPDIVWFHLNPHWSRSDWWRTGRLN